MKIIFLDIDGVITHPESHWHIDKDKLILINDIIKNTNAKIVVTSSWKHGYTNVEKFKEKLNNISFTQEVKNELIFKEFLENIYDITDSCGSLRGEEVERWVNKHKKDVETYVILDDDSDFKEKQLFNFVQTDYCEGLTQREVKLCIKILNKEKITNPIRLNLALITMWRNRCSNLEDNNIEELLKQYYKSHFNK